MMMVELMRKKVINIDKIISLLNNTYNKNNDQLKKIIMKT